MNTNFDPAKASGLEKLHFEMSRQHQDALDSFRQATPVAKEIAQSLKTAPRLLLLGMGASHWANRIVEPIFRKASIDATAQPVSEYLRAPLPRGGRTVLLTSQSGESGEIIKFLDEMHTPGRTFGLTLNPKSALGNRVPSLIGAGGMEVGFAATRSLLVTLALHAAVLRELGITQDELEKVLSNPVPVECPDPAAKDAEKEIASSSCVVFSSRNIMQGVADAGALCLMELARIPAFSLEGGQFLHGPCEMLKPGIGIVLFRPVEDTSNSIRRIAETCVGAGLKPVVFDLTNKDDLRGCIRIPLPGYRGLAGAAAALVTAQSVLVKTASVMVPDVGCPVRSNKVTNGE
ncbi:MAG: SIS domain-containing protein [Desulfovibrio sp.]|uniref:SIS domain-containing protein n=1 Tax=Desulfovibrio sp. 7SRBS1 TaxID=3378064 RepID=UPI003B3EF009